MHWKGTLGRSETSWVQSQILSCKESCRKFRVPSSGSSWVIHYSPHSGRLFQVEKSWVNRKTYDSHEHGQDGVQCPVGTWGRPLSSLLAVRWAAHSVLSLLALSLQGENEHLQPVPFNHGNTSLNWEYTRRENRSNNEEEEGKDYNVAGYSRTYETNVLVNTSGPARSTGAWLASCLHSALLLVIKEVSDYWDSLKGEVYVTLLRGTWAWKDET